VEFKYITGLIQVTLDVGDRAGVEIAVYKGTTGEKASLMMSDTYDEGKNAKSRGQ
jgi:hypothetical protein